MRLSIIFLTLLSAVIPNNAYAKNRVIVLTDKNTVSLRLPITNQTVEPVQKAIRSLSQKGVMDIYLVLNSPGGSVHAGKRLIDSIAGMEARVHTISMFSASMSFMISQALGRRLAIPSATIMSHRAFVAGIEGQIPGNFLSRTNAILAEITDLEMMVAKRVGISHRLYSDLVRDELWMTGKGAQNANFIDEVVEIRCDKTLEGTEAPIALQIAFFEINVSFPKCPLLEEPAQIAGPKDMSSKDSLRLYHNYLQNNSPEPSFSKWGVRDATGVK